MSYALRNLPSEDRPRERLLKGGAESLSLSELLAILLSTGTKGKSSLLLAQEVLARFGSLSGLLEASIAELEEIKGIGSAKAISLKAALEIASRATGTDRAEKPPARTSNEIYALVKDCLGNAKQEMLMVVLRDVKGRAIHQELIGIGTLSEVLVHPREVFYPAVRHKAHSLVVVHNHPSGDPTPSKADIDLTAVLVQSGRVMGINLADHLIVGAGKYTSLRQEGYF